MNKLSSEMFQLARLTLRPALTTLRRGGRTLFSTRYLLYTNTGVCVVLSCTGDVLQQNYQIMNNKLKSWDSTRTFHVSCTGFLVGPLFHYWYMYLDKWFPGRTLKVVVKKIALDQLICSPIFISTFLVALCVMENASWKKIKSDLIAKGTTLYKAECFVWPPAQLVNFMFVPPKFRVLYDNTLAFGFDCYFSYVRYDKPDDSDKCLVDEDDDDGGGGDNNDDEAEPHELKLMNKVTAQSNENVPITISLSDVSKTVSTLCEHQLLLS